MEYKLAGYGKDDHVYTYHSNVADGACDNAVITVGKAC